MSRGKLRRSKKKNKTPPNEDKSNNFDYEPHGEERETPRSEKLKPDSAPREKERSSKSPERKSEKRKTSKKVHIALLPDRYEPLEEEDEAEGHTEEKTKEKQHKYHKFRKNVGKAFRYSWKCLVVGLQSFSSGYSGPLSAAATLVPQVQRPSSRA
ncbi:required for drug-induced death protein 1 [Hoplias malabaricus]|uniref:required for drug-induced death protein 1 n=1 Tax=Hoplias malabaricus TaxID=27720 RepID=UPI003461F700